MKKTILVLLILFSTVLLADDSIKILKGHKKGISAIAVDHDYIYSGSLDKTIKIWDKKTKKCLKTVSLHKNKITSIVFDNKYIYVGSFDSVYVLDKKNFSLYKLIDLECEEVSKLIVDNKYLYVVSLDSLNIKIFDKKSGKIVKKLKGHKSGISTITKDKENIYTGGPDGTIKIWNKKNGVLQKTIKSHKRFITKLSVDNKYIYSISWDSNTIKIWDKKKGTLVKNLSYYYDKYKDIVIDKDYFYTACDSTALIAWDKDKTIRTKGKANGSIMYNFIYDTNSNIETVDTDDDYLYSGESNGDIRIWKKPLSYDKLQKMYKKVKVKNSLFEYNNIFFWYPELPQQLINQILLDAYKLVKQNDNIAVYMWFVKLATNQEKIHASNSSQIKKVIEKSIEHTYELAFKKAKNINTISAYNTFIISFPYAKKQIEEANKLAYKLEKEKKVKKILLKIKQLEIEKDNINEKKYKKYTYVLRRGYLIILNRMYKFLQDKFDDSNKALKYSSFKEYNANKDIKIDISIVKLAKEGFKRKRADKEMKNFMKNQKVILRSLIL